MLGLRRPEKSLRDHGTTAARSAGSAALAYRAALALDRRGRLDEAEKLYLTALATERAHAGAWQGLGLIRLRQGRLDEAARLLRKTVNLEPNSAIAQGNLGYVLMALERYDDAAQRYKKAITLAPDHAEAHNNFAGVSWHLRRVDEALSHRKRAQEIAPEAAEAHLNEAIARLTLGDFEQGWSKYEWRWRHRGLGLIARDYPQPLWLGGGTLEGKTILLHAEQGLGDTLQFVRYVPLVAACKARVVLEVQPSLVPLLATVPGLSRILPHGAPLPAFDCHCPLLSLPLAFGTRLDTIPAAVPYLQADPECVASWRRRLAPLGGAKVGLVWAGSPGLGQARLYQVDRRRSLRLSQLGALAQVPGVSFVSLQKGEAAAQARRSPAGMTVHDWTDELEDFAATAGLVEALDLVISVDTSVAHLAGALGKPVWLLNRFDSCWRWLLDRDDSPWYPTLRQFRQKRSGEWDSVIESVVAALHRHPRQAIEPATLTI